MRRAQRLTRRRDFAAVYRRGRIYRSEVLVLRALKSGLPASRFGFTAGKALGTAVVRNRLKRRLREIARGLAVEGGWDVVINTRRGVENMRFDALRAEVESLMTRAGLLGTKGA